jgi:hypothetical protein
MRFWIDPILRDAGPLCAKSLLIDVGVLDDESPYQFRMCQNDAEADWPTVIMKVEAAFADA